MAELLKGRRIHGGRARAEVLVSSEALSFFGGVDPDTGVVTERGHPLEGQSVAGKVLVFPHGKGSTVGSYSIYRLARKGCGPAAIINQQCETIVAVGAIIADIPCVDRIELARLGDGALVEVDADRGTVEVLEP
jgi:predicted aconitase with swiveling domain